MADGGSDSGEVVVIAGAAGGLGPAVAALLAGRGATIVATGRDQSRLDALGEALAIGAERFDGRAVDLLDERATRDWAASVVERFGRVDAVVHLVGGWRGGESITATSLDDYTWLNDLLVRTTQHVSRAFHDALAASAGRFVLISATQARRPTATNASYAAAKAAAETWTLALADSLHDSGATANVIVVNAIVTAAMREANPDRDYGGFTSDVAIAEAIAFLLSDGAAGMTGARLELHT